MSGKYDTYVMADANDPRSIIEATQKSVLDLLDKIIADAKTMTGAPGLTWEMLDEIIKHIREKKPTVVEQKGMM